MTTVAVYCPEQDVKLFEYLMDKVARKVFLRAIIISNHLVLLICFYLTLLTGSIFKRIAQIPPSLIPIKSISPALAGFVELVVDYLLSAYNKTLHNII